MAHEIVGISGTSASGKDTAAEHLASRGFLHVSTADIIRAEATRLYGSTEQHILRRVGHEMRVRNGVGAVCLKAIVQYEEQKDKYEGVVVSSIRAIGPAQAIRDNGGLMMSVDAPAEIRYERLIARGRVGESTSFEEFLKFEEEELNGTLSTGQNVRGIQEISDVHIYNDADLPTFISRVEQAVGLNE